MAEVLQPPAFLDQLIRLSLPPQNADLSLSDEIQTFVFHRAFGKPANDILQAYKNNGKEKNISEH